MDEDTLKVIRLEVSIELANKIEQMAERLQRSSGWIGEQALLAWISRVEEEDALMAEAIEDIRAGRVIDHKSIQDWADSLDTDKPLQMPKVPG